MIKAMTYFKRRAGMDPEAFQARWRDGHADVVRRLPGVRRYVQSHPLLGGYRRGDLAFDGVASVWFDDVAAMRAAAATPEYAAVQADESVFIAPGSTGLLLVEEVVIKDLPAPAGGVKSMSFLRRRPDLSPEAFQRYWREVHGPLAAAIPPLQRYVQNHVRLSGYARTPPPAFDGIPEAWFADVPAMRRSAGTDERKRVLADEPNFFLADSKPVILAREIVIV